ncbi:zinc finger protein 41 [Patella vulgata]|uniref:zinc finger protein 41 n=1 Tax=Patella vulgata TaxID=6465 RepID=UPI00217F3D33|nr:zinc finger protein 41 [Patella vulgata]XP_050416026.1 zinc finger protein 41 [Patella vulgata]
MTDVPVAVVNSTVMQLNAEDIDEVDTEENESLSTEITQTLHTDSVSYSCALCDQEFNSERQFFEHRINHDECPQCQEQYLCQKELFIHASSHDSENFKCLLCRKILDDVNSLEVHLSDHRSNFTTYDCEQCSRKFLSTEEIHIHKESHPVVNTETHNTPVTFKRKNEDTEFQIINDIGNVEKKVKHVVDNEKYMFRVSKDGLQLIDNARNSSVEYKLNPSTVQDVHVESNNIDASNSSVGEVVHFHLNESSDSKESNCIYVWPYKNENDNQTNISVGENIIIDNEDIHIVNLDSEAISNVNIPAGYLVNEDGVLEIQEDYQNHESQAKIVLSTVDGSDIINYQEVKNDEDPFKCGYCSQPYSDSMELFVHMTQEHYEKLNRQ